MPRSHPANASSQSRELAPRRKPGKPRVCHQFFQRETRLSTCLARRKKSVGNSARGSFGEFPGWCGAFEHLHNVPYSGTICKRSTRRVRAKTLIKQHPSTHNNFRIAAHAFGPQHWPSLLGTSIAFVPGLAADQRAMTFEDNKTHFVAGTPQPPDNGFAEHIAEYVRHQVVGWAFSKRVAETGVAPANTVSLRNNYDATDADAQTFISSVGALCSALRSAGEDPVVLVGQAAPASYLHTYKWGGLLAVSASSRDNTAEW